MPVLPPLDRSLLEQLSRVLEGAATHRELGELISSAGMPPAEEGPKWSRILNACLRSQARYNSANQVLALVQQIMNPVRFAGRAEDFRGYRDNLNLVLAFAGYGIKEDGQIRTVDRAATLTEAEERASTLRSELSRRHVHTEVLRFCTPELVALDYFHAVLEATKSVMERIRQMTGLPLDGAELIDAAFSASQGAPLLAFNALDTAGKRGEQAGLMNLMKGMYGTFRTPTGHDPRITWRIGEQDAFDLLTLASMLHRRLDTVVRTGHSLKRS